MSTRCSTIFIHKSANAEDSVVASIYRHHDGYPDGHGAELVAFLNDVAQQSSFDGPYKDRFFESPGQLAAWWLIWKTQQADWRDFKNLDIEICGDHTHGDVVYRYEVLCWDYVKPTIRVHQRGLDENDSWYWAVMTEDLETHLKNETVAP